jgi:transglutaminase-like putative cysteine protease
MHLRVLHRTHYFYRYPVTESHNEVRLRPATEDPKRLTFFLLKVQPPRRLRHFRDDFFNYVQWFEIPDAHTELIIEATSHIHTTSQYAAGVPTGCDFHSLANELTQMDVLRPFLTSCCYITLNQEIWRLAVDVRAGLTDVFATAQAIMNFIHAHWLYSPNTTHVQTQMHEVLVDRRGVCQDFAHVMLGMCRSLGIPARYVSGYLYNGPLGHLRGAQASHAWCEVWLPERGWFGLDPTNNTLADERYIKIATGRDYEDAAPIRGTFSAPAGASAGLHVTVEVEERP